MKNRHRQDLGSSGEQLALTYLLDKGLQCLERNYRCRGGELDLIMLDGKTLALVEVRLRSDDGYGGAAASVTPLKQRRLIVAAKHLLMTQPNLARYRARFDVVALGNAERGTYEIEWIKDAFRL